MRNYLKKIFCFFKENPSLILILLGGLILRVIFACLRENLSGGDPFNYLFIAEKLKDFSYPLDAKRLPFYPFLLMLGLPFLDGIVWGKIINLVSSFFCLPLLFLIGQELKIKKIVLYLATLFLAVQFLGLENSLRPLADSLFSCLALLSIYLFFKAKTKKSQLLFGLVLGLTCLTRYEGFLLALALCPFLIYRQSRPLSWLGIKKSLYFLIPWLIIISPWFIRNILLFHNPFHSGYWHYEKLGLFSWAHLTENFKRLVSIFVFFWGKGNILSIKISGLVTSFLVLAGLIKLIKVSLRKASPILIFLCLEGCLMLWWAPINRYFPPLIPFFSLFLALGIFELTEIKGLKRVFSYILISGLTLLIVYNSLFYAFERLQTANHDDQTYILYRAVKYLADQAQGKVGLARDYPMAVYYLKNRGVYLARIYTEKTEEEQYQWLIKSQPAYLVRTPRSREMLSIIDSQKYQDKFKLFKKFTNSHNPDLFIEIYQVNF